MTSKLTTCALTTTANLIGGKYKLEILYFLMGKTRRFSDLQRKFPQATAKVLSQKLKELEADGLIEKEIFPVIPPKTEYSLTERGQSLAPVMLALFQWGNGYFQEIGKEEFCDMEEVARLSQIYQK